MKKIAFIFLIVTMTISCCYNDNNVIGKYYSYQYENGVVHYVELFPDSTYNHVYIQNGVINENKGVWTIYRKTNSRIFVDFHNWENFGYAKDYCIKHDLNLCHNVIIKNKRMLFHIDDYDLNFKKK